MAQLLVATFQFALTALSYSRFYPFSLLFSFILTATALVLNNLLIPRWGMDGASVATLAANAIYFALAVITVHWVLGCRILTRRHLLTILLLTVLFALNSLCLRWVPVANIWLSSLMRSMLIVVAAWLAYRWQLSPELNSLIHDKLSSLNHRT